MFKLIVIDIDGTLFDSHGEVSNQNREAIKYAINKGVQIVLASGREPQSIKKISLDLGIKNYLIAGNGANVYSIKDDKNIYKSYIQKKKALEIIENCKKNSIFVNVYTSKGIIAEKLEYNVKVFYNENNNKTSSRRTKIEIVEDIVKYVKEHDLEILKIIVCDNDKIIFGNMVQKLKKISEIDVLEVEHMSRKIIRIGTEEIRIEYFYTEITNKNTSKWTAVEYLIKILNIKKDDTICIGDNLNDKKMIEEAGLGIVMKNSALSSMKIGDFITADNDSSGVANAIYKFI